MFILLPVILPFVSALIIAVSGSLKKNLKLLHFWAALSAGLSFVLVVLAVLKGEAAVPLWYLTKDISVYFHFDTLGMVFALVTGFIFAFNVFFSFEYMKHEGSEGRYFTFFLLTLGSLNGICFSGNLVTAYIFYEMMSLVSMPLVLHSLTGESITAAKKYIIYSMGGAFLGLSAFFAVYPFAGGFTFVPGGCLNGIEGNETLILVVSLLFITGFGSKAGLWPLHAWLPTAHPVAPAPASAVLSGNITKMGVLMIIRYIYYIVGTDLLRGSFVQYAFMIMTLITVFMGSMMAYKEDGLKKRLAYSSVSQVSYILFGLSTMTLPGFAGAIMHVVYHSLVKNTLFLNAGAIIYKTGKTKVSELTGIGKQMPVTLWCFTLVSLTLVGIPPTSAFVSKWYLCLGSLDTGMGGLAYIGPVVLILSALLTAGYLISIVMKGFFPGEDYYKNGIKVCEPSLFMLVPMVVFTIPAVVFGIYPGDFIQILMNLAKAVM